MADGRVSISFSADMSGLNKQLDEARAKLAQLTAQANSSGSGGGMLQGLQESIRQTTVQIEALTGKMAALENKRASVLSSQVNIAVDTAAIGQQKKLVDAAAAQYLASQSEAAHKVLSNNMQFLEGLRAGRAEEVAILKGKLKEVADIAAKEAAIAKQSVESKKTIGTEIEILDRRGAASHAEHIRRQAGDRGRLQQYQWTNLSYQVNDVVSGFAMGQSPLTILAQQGGQVYQVLADAQGGVVGGLKAVRASLFALATPVTLGLGGIAIAAVAAIGYLISLKLRADAVRDAMREMGTSVALAGRGGNFQYIDAELSRFQKRATAGTSWISGWGVNGEMSKGLGDDDAKKLGTTLATIPGASAPLLNTFAEIARVEKAAFGDEAQGHLEGFAAALADPDAAGLKFVDTLGFMDTAEREYLKSQIQHADQSGKLALITDGLISRTRALLAEKLRAVSGYDALSEEQKQEVNLAVQQIKTGQALNANLSSVSKEASNLGKEFSLASRQLEVFSGKTKTASTDLQGLQKIAQDIALGENPLSKQFEDNLARINALKAGMLDTSKVGQSLASNYAAAVHAIENPNDKKGANSAGAEGKYQFTPATWAQYGAKYGDVTDNAAQEKAFADFTAANTAALKAAIAREPTLADLYLAHQQGAAGAAKLLNNPLSRAGDLVGDKAISQNGGDPDAMASVFVQKWKARFNKELAASGIGETFKKEALAGMEDKNQQIADKIAGGSAVALAELEIAKQNAAGLQDVVRDEEKRLEALRAQLSVTHELEARNQKSQEIAAKELALKEQKLAVTRAETQLELAKVNASDPKKKRDLEVATATKDRDQFAPGTEGYAAANQRIIEAERTLEQTLLTMKRTAEQAKVDAKLAALAQEEQIIQERAASEKITEQQKNNLLANVMERRQALEKTHAEFLRDSYEKDAVAYQQHQEKLNLINKQATIERENQQRRAALELENSYKSVFNEIGSTVSSSIMGMIQGQQKLVDAARSVTLQLIGMFLQAGVRMVANHLAQVAAKTAGTIGGQAAETGATAAGVAARTGIEGAGAAAGAGANIAKYFAQIQAAAAATYANVFAWASPIMGPLAVVPAVAASGLVIAQQALLPSFAVGAWNLPNDMVAQVHKGEMIVPANAAGGLRSALSGGGGGQGQTTHMNLTYNAASGTSLDVVKTHAREFAKIIKDQFDRNPALRPTY